VCGKKIHHTIASAEEHLADLKADTREHPVRIAMLRVYFCQPCHGWHVGHNRSVQTAANARRRRLRKLQRR